MGKRVPQHTNVINAAKKAGVKRIVYTSLLYADSSSLILAPEHLTTEGLLKDSGIPHTILRNGWYTENYTANLKDAVSRGVIIGSAGNGKISSATREDYAQAIVEVLSNDDHTGKTYELAGDDFYTLEELAAEVSRQSGKKIDYQNLPEKEYAKQLQEVGLPQPMAEAIASMDASAARNDLYNEDRVLSGLINRPTTSLEQAVKQALK